ncbi:MAG TPA: hypothetical protein VMW23_08780 [Sedimentisphaerales bacterium]|nr:hypothetical protein [Sedimentisphaerales bacterium]
MMIYTVARVKKAISFMHSVGRIRKEQNIEDNTKDNRKKNKEIKTMPVSKKTKTKSQLLESIENLSIEELARLELHLLPVIKARTAMMDFALVQIPADNEELLQIGKARSLLLDSDTQEDKDKLNKLNEKLNEIRKAISNHIEKRVQLKNAMDTANHRFARHY